jgi:hypothetical protein
LARSTNTYHRPLDRPERYRSQHLVGLIVVVMFILSVLGLR